VLGERLADAVLHGAGLARKPAALDGGDHVVLALAARHLERLVDHQAQRRTGEIDFLLAAVDHDLAAAGLEPDAGDRVLAAAGGVGTALRIDLLLAEHRRGRRRGGGGALRGVRDGGARQRVQLGEIADRGRSVLGFGFGSVLGSHYAAALFLRLSEATSSTSGWLPACGCSVPA